MIRTWILGIILAACGTPRVQLSINEERTHADRLKETGHSESKQTALRQDVLGPTWFRSSRYTSSPWEPLWNNLELSSVGEQQAVILTSLGYVAVDRNKGFIGKLEGVFATDRIGLGESDDVYVLKADGQLWRFPGLSSLLESTPSDGTLLGTWSDWRAFDTAPGCIAVAHKDAVSISSNGGQSFHASHPVPGKIINGVWCRSDGLVAAEVVYDKTVGLYSTGNTGRSWKRLPEGPTRLFRDGVFLWGQHNKCPYVLSRDGDDWIKTSFSDIPNQARWLQRATLPRAHTTLGASGGYTSSQTSMFSDEELTAHQCIKPASLSDGTDAGIDADERAPSSHCAPRECLNFRSIKTPVGQRLRVALSVTSEASHIILADMDERLITSEKPPSGCDPQFVRQGPGIFVLGCSNESGLGLYTSGNAQKWHLEGELTGLSSFQPSLDWAEDGTLLINSLCRSDQAPPHPPSSCRFAALRKPSKLGNPGLWHVLPQSENTLAHRVLTNGRALIVNAASSQRSDVLSLGTFTGEGGLVPLCVLPRKGHQVTEIKATQSQLIVSFGGREHEVVKRIDLGQTGHTIKNCSFR